VYNRAVRIYCRQSGGGLAVVFHSHGQLLAFDERRTKGNYTIGCERRRRYRRTFIVRLTYDGQKCTFSTRTKIHLDMFLTTDFPTQIDVGVFGVRTFRNLSIGYIVWRKKQIRFTFVLYEVREFNDHFLRRRPMFISKIFVGFSKTFRS